MHLLDTDTLTYLHAGHSRVIERLRELADPDVGTTIITKIELLRGRFDFMLKAATGTELLRAQQLLARTEELLAQIVVVPVDEAAAVQFDRLRAIKGLRKIGRADLLIASIALAHRATLVTRNVRHFQQISSLIVTNWVD
ncbi:MAG: type II toxin-antitoxin system VapC family toxin [Deltaproteobacteria bacterium]|nr:type II toxin-antitoxin system VapC family toxin [Deltaproteobacteria bacterium]